jgi:hypothetical protein
VYSSEVSIKIAHVIITASLGYLLYRQSALLYQSGSFGHSCFSQVLAQCLSDLKFENETQTRLGKSQQFACCLQGNSKASVLFFDDPDEYSNAHVHSSSPLVGYG